MQCNQTFQNNCGMFNCVQYWLRSDALGLSRSGLKEGEITEIRFSGFQVCETQIKMEGVRMEAELTSVMINWNKRVPFARCFAICSQMILQIIGFIYCAQTNFVEGTARAVQGSPLKSMFLMTDVHHFKNDFCVFLNSTSRPVMKWLYIFRVDLRPFLSVAIWQKLKLR